MSSGGTSSRGGGFGGAANMGGPNMMYTYEIKPLNTLLTQKQPMTNNYEEIHVGMSITGNKINDKDGKRYSGHIIRIVKTDNDAIKYYMIVSQNGDIIKIDPTSAEIIDIKPIDNNKF